MSFPIKKNKMLQCHNTHPRSCLKYSWSCVKQQKSTEVVTGWHHQGRWGENSSCQDWSIYSPPEQTLHIPKRSHNPREGEILEENTQGKECQCNRDLKRTNRAWLNLLGLGIVWIPGTIPTQRLHFWETIKPPGKILWLGKPFWSCLDNWRIEDHDLVLLRKPHVPWYRNTTMVKKPHFCEMCFIINVSLLMFHY